MRSIPNALAGLLFLLPMGCAQRSASPLERYRNLEFPPAAENFDQGWQERLAVEFDVINRADPGALRTALKDPDPFVRSIAARALGIRGDKASADALADLAQADPKYMVRIRAVESLGYLKMRPEVVERAKKDENGSVRWSATMAAAQIASETDYAAPIRKAYAAGIKRREIGRAQVGQPAPDFVAQTTDGKRFQLSTLLRKKPVAIYFAAFDG